MKTDPIYSQIWIILFFFLLASPAPAGTPGATQITTQNTHISVKGAIELTGAVTPELLSTWQQAVNRIFQTQLYKCYRIDYDIKLSARSPESNLSGLLGLSHTFMVLDVTGDPETAALFEKYGLYQDHDWQLYDDVHGTGMRKLCGWYKKQEYKKECAKASQWFFEHFSEGTTRGLSTAADVDASGSSYIHNQGIVTNMTPAHVFAHEVGHALGIDDHADGQTSLMNKYAGAHQTSILHESLHDMLEDLDLECRYSFELNNEAFSIVNDDTCPAKKCVANLRGAAKTVFTAETYDNILEGTGDTSYESVSYNLDINTGGCTSSVDPQNGRLKIEGMVESGDASLFASFVDTQLTGIDPAETVVLDLTPTFTLDPMENAVVSGPYAAAGIPTPMLKNMMIGGGFKEFRVVLGDPDDPGKILFPINFSHDFPLNHGCIQIFWKLATDDLVITKVEPLKGR